MLADFTIFGQGGAVAVLILLVLILLAVFLAEASLMRWWEWAGLVVLAAVNVWVFRAVWR